MGAQLFLSLYCNWVMVPGTGALITLCKLWVWRIASEPEGAISEPYCRQSIHSELEDSEGAEGPTLILGMTWWLDFRSSWRTLDDLMTCDFRSSWRTHDDLMRCDFRGSWRTHDYLMRCVFRSSWRTHCRRCWLVLVMFVECFPTFSYLCWGRDLLMVILWRDVRLVQVGQVASLWHPATGSRDLWD